MLNLEQMAYLLLVQSLPESYTVVPDLDVDSIDQFPTVTFTVTGGNALDGSGGKPNAWDCNLSLSVFDDDLDDAINSAKEVYDAVWSWNDPWGAACRVDGLGNAAAIEDQSVFTRAGTVAIDARSVTQMVGGFNLQMHEA